MCKARSACGIGTACGAVTRTVVFWPGETIGGSNWNEKGADHGVEIDTGTFKSAFSAPRILTEMLVCVASLTAGGV